MKDKEFRRSCHHAIREWGEKKGKKETSSHKLLAEPTEEERKRE